MWRIPPAPPGFFRLGKSLLSVEDTGAYFVSHERFCEAYYYWCRRSALADRTMHQSNTGPNHANRGKNHRKDNPAKRGRVLRWGNRAVAEGWYGNVRLAGIAE